MGPRTTSGNWRRAGFAPTSRCLIGTGAPPTTARPCSRTTRSGISYLCPQGATLRRQKVDRTARKIVRYQADAAVCNACPVKAACTPGEHGRGIARSFDAEYLDRVRGYHETEEYAKAMRKRKVWIEPLFGEAKQ